MAVVADTQQAVAILHGIQGRLQDSGDIALSQQVAVMIKLLDSPSFKQLLNLQQAIRQLKEHIGATPPGKQAEFDFSPEGELVLPHEEEDLEEKARPESPGANHPFAFVNTTFEPDEETVTPTKAHDAASAPTLPVGGRPKRISLNDEGLVDLAFKRDLIAVDLTKPASGGLGFTVVGLNSLSHGDLGIFIQKIQPDGVAARDGRLRESDQILAINDQILHTGVSHREAIDMLHKIQGEVYLIVARGDIDLPAPPEVSPANTQAQQLQNQSVQPNDVATDGGIDEVDSESLETEEFVPEIMTINLTNDGSGLGFGIVGVHNTGIVVKTIVKGGVADRDGRLESGDIILQIGDTRLEGMNSTQVARVLRQSGNNVQLTVIKKGIGVPSQQLKLAPPEEPKVAEPKVETVEKETVQTEEAAPSPLPTSPPPDAAVLTSSVELDIFEVDLQKTSQGLGLSIAGFEENRPDGVEAGIFVKGIADGSAAALSQKINVGDQIIEVDGQPVNGFGNRQAVELLRRTGSLVHLKLARRKRRKKSTGEAVIIPPKIPEVATKSETKAPETVLTEVAKKEEVKKEEVKEKEEEKVEVEEKTEEKETAEEKEDEEEEKVVEMERPIEAAASAALLASVVLDDRQDEEAEEERQEDVRVQPPSPEPPRAKLTLPSQEPSYVGVMSRKDPAVQIALWQGTLGPMVTVLVSDVEKKGSLGIVLEGRVDIDENGQEIQPRHYISTVVPDGPVGKQGLLEPGDELLEVNGIRLYGRNHHEVVDILRSLPPKVCLVCGRHSEPPTVIEADSPTQTEAVHEEVVPEQVLSVEATAPSVEEPEIQIHTAVDDEKAPNLDDTPTIGSGDSISLQSDTQSAVSHESLMGVSVWSDQVQLVTLIKGDQGLGFSILDYQDPLKPDCNVILIRSLVEGGIAEQDGRLIPGDRLMSVNDINLENATLETAVDAVRGAPRGVVKIGVAKPLPSSIIEEQREALAQQAKEEEEKRLSMVQDVPVVAMKASVAHAAVPAEKTNPPDLIANGPPQPAPRKSLSSSPPPEPNRPPPSLPAISPASVSRKRRPLNVELPESLEKTLVIKKTNSALGVTVSADKTNGAIITIILPGGCIKADGTLKVGDYITAVNGDSTRNMSNTNVRSLLRKCFLGGSEISLRYISAADADAYRAQLAEVNPADDSSSQDSSEEMWEDIRVVNVYREHGKSLGISILGGRVGQGQLIEGIFIKHVLEDSPAGRTGDLKTGDRILEVNDCDLRDATHDQAVAIIKNAPNPVKFKVQSLSPELQPSYLMDMDQPFQAKMIKTGSMDDLDKSDSDDVDADTKETSSSSAPSVPSDSDSEDEYGYSKKIITERYKHLPGEYLILDVEKSKSSLGLSLAGNKDTNIMSVFVVGINPTSPAAEDGRIMVGDELIEINGIKVYGHNHREASMIIGDLPEGEIKLVIRRRNEALNELAVDYVETTPVNQVPAALRKPSGIVLDLTDGGHLEEESTETDLTSFPNVHKITLNKGTTGLGFFIYEKKDEKGRPGIFVKEVSPGGAAGQEGTLQVDDQILAVNDLQLIGLTKMSAISVLKGTHGLVELTVSSAKLPESSDNPYLFISKSLEEALDEDIEFEEVPMSPTLLEDVQQELQSPMEDPLELDTSPLTIPILQKTQTSIIIDRGSNSLGLKIAGGSDTDIPSIIIDDVIEGGAAAKDGRLKPGDQILAINGMQLDNVTHSEALHIFRDVPPLVPMIVFRVESDAASSETWQELVIDLEKKKDQGLGLSIVGRKNDRGVFISDIVIGGTAFRDGRLMRGDRLLAVDGTDVVNASKDDVAPLLRNVVGKVLLKVGRLTAEVSKPDSAVARPSLDQKAAAKSGSLKDDSLLSDLINDPQLGTGGGGSGYSEDEGEDEEEEEEDVVDRDTRIQTVHLDRGPDGLGFSIVGGAGSPHGDLPIYIKTVFDRGAAASSGVLKRGDQIVEVNGQNLEGTSHKEAVNILKQVRGKVVLKIISR